MSTPSKKRSPTKCADQQRVVLLLDMDCFYAQCETVRLGLDREIPLALIQWNSALAVSYPARKFGIVRGDSFEKIREKSNGACVCIHLPVTSLNDSTSPTRGQELNANMQSQNDAENGAAMGHLEEDIKASYDAEFNQPAHVRDDMYKREKNKMRSRNEGKACLDRYRLASARIFSLIDETLANNLGRRNYTLERASIDELFIDVTSFCNNPERDQHEKIDDNDNEIGVDFASAEKQFRSTCQNNAMQSLQETNICDENNLHPNDINAEKALVLGCHIARIVRRAVFDELRFTLSAGISTSKLVAKLGATYGKPNGQAVIFPGAITKVMDETQIKKARMLGGKLGKKVLSLLPENETTMGSVARLLSLDDLIKGVGEEAGRWVFDACRGICTEEVKSTLRVLPKSITAFKSFSSVGYPELEKWTELLASDIVKRVELDTARNNRAPKSCTLGFTTDYGGPWIGKSVRLTFPSDREFDTRVKRLCDNTRKVLTENGVSNVIRLGFSAIDFVARPSKGIESFFAPAPADVKKSPTKTSMGTKNGTCAKQKCQTKKPNGIEAFFSSGKNTARQQDPNHCNNQKCVAADESTQLSMTGTKINESAIAAPADLVNNSDTLTDEEIARRLHNELNNNSTADMMQPAKEIDRDQTVAMKLQSKYDRENDVLTRVEKYSAGNKRKMVGKTETQKGAAMHKKSKLDSYFLLKK